MRLMKRPPITWKSEHNRAYFSKLFDATPQWLSAEQQRQYHAIYTRARRLRRQGQDVHVDHIVPLRHPLVCGLNVPWNLQIIGAGPNMSKGNNWWPGCPWESLSLFDHEPQQLRLSI
jgi:hypothetical protein